MRTPWFVALLIGLTACAPSSPRELRIPLPEAVSRAELIVVRDHLRQTETSLPDGVSFFTSLDIEMKPEPAIRIHYDPDHIRIQNLYTRIHALGYTVPDRPGDWTVKIWSEDGHGLTATVAVEDHQTRSPERGQGAGLNRFGGAVLGVVGILVLGLIIASITRRRRQ